MIGSLKRPDQQKIYVQVAEQIEQLIQSGELVPGNQLLPERELAGKLHVSRTSVRNALALLEGRGVIEVTARDGAYVRRRSLEGAVEPLTQILFQERGEVSNQFEVRQIIETQAGRLAALRRDEADLRRLRELNQEFETSLYNNLDLQANTRFHLAIVRAAKNPLLTEIMTALLTAMLEVYAAARHQSLSSIPNLLRFADEHEQIIEAIAQQDPDLVATLLAKHIDDARQRVEMIM